ncbi:MAG: hypothetical protein RIR05_1476, partial [Bacteroidota bacterium]
LGSPKATERKRARSPDRRHRPKQNNSTKLINSPKNCDRDTKGLVHCKAITERKRARSSPGRRHRPKQNNSTKLINSPKNCDRDT